MRILVIGSGAREHAIVWKLAQSSRVEKIFVAPGNPGMEAHAERVNLGVEQLVELATFVEAQHIDLTVVGPEVPLILGIVDLFRERGLRIFGPDKAGAALEGSKAFTKELLTSAGIPTAEHRTFTNYEAAQSYLDAHGAPVVLKADGNAAGKGAIVSLDLASAQNALKQMMVDRVFGSAGETVVIEDYLEGDEVSTTAICYGQKFLPLLLSQDHKRARDGDLGANTGGMGAYLPLPFVSSEQEAELYRTIVSTTLQAMVDHGTPFNGVLYTNIMLTKQGPKIIEHNTRFGDPECQAFMMLMKEDLLTFLDFDGSQSDTLTDVWHPGYGISLTLAAGGYPEAYQKGIPIYGIEEANRLENVHVFHAGTSTKDGQLVTSGGRVLSVVARGISLEDATARAYEAAKLIRFDGMHYRKDIAHRSLRAF